MTKIPHWKDCLNSDGSFNLSAIMQIAWQRARDSRNAQICISHGISAAKAYGVRLGEVGSFYAKQVSTLSIPSDLRNWGYFFSRELAFVWDSARVAQRNLKVA